MSNFLALEAMSKVNSFIFYVKMDCKCINVLEFLLCSDEEPSSLT